MNLPKTSGACLAALLALACFPAHATVSVTSMRPSPRSPQAIGTSVTWAVTATDSNPGPLTFQFNVAPPKGPFSMVRDFNVGSLRNGVWRPVNSFVWTPTGIEGTYRIQVVIKDFATKETATKTLTYTVAPLVTSSTPVAVATANPLVALFSAPACPAGSSMRVSFQPQSASVAATLTNNLACDGIHTMTFEIVGMYPSTAYQLIAQTTTGSSTVNSSPVSFTTGPLPTGLTFPPFKTITGVGPDTDTVDSVLLHGVVQLGGGTHYPDVATDLSNNIVWYYAPTTGSDLLTRPLPNGFLSLQSGSAWNSFSNMSQMLRQFDWAGNLVRETNTGILQQELLAMGAADAGPCNAFASPAPVGSACLGGFHHDAIQSLPGGKTIVIADIEKIFPPGTQGDTSGLPLDIVGDIFIVLDANWKPVWYFDTFDHDMGAPQLDLSRPAVLGDTCVNQESGCPPIFLLGPGIAKRANDWLHANSLYYWPAPYDGASGGDIIWSSRHQDWVMKIDYRDGNGTGNILWRMGPGGDFSINSTDPWPWFSHQHEVAMENGGAGPMTIFDNGNTRLSPPTGPRSSTGGTPGLGTNCGNECNSRGLVLNIDETTKQATPILSQDLGYFSTAMGAAQMLSNGNYFFLPAFVVVSARSTDSFAMEIMPTTGVAGSTVLSLRSSEAYRGWQMPSLYAPPIS